MGTQASLLGTKLRTLITRLDDAVERQYLDSGLDYRPRFTPVVKLLQRAEPVRIMDVAVATGQSHSAASQTVKEMIKKGWLESRPGEDGRERNLSATAQLKAALPDLNRLWARTAIAARSLDTDAGTDFELIIDRILVALDERPFNERLAAVGEGGAAISL